MPYKETFLEKVRPLDNALIAIERKREELKNAAMPSDLRYNRLKQKAKNAIEKHTRKKKPANAKEESQQKLKELEQKLKELEEEHIKVSKEELKKLDEKLSKKKHKLEAKLHAAAKTERNDRVKTAKKNKKKCPKGTRRTEYGCLMKTPVDLANYRKITRPSELKLKAKYISVHESSPDQEVVQFTQVILPPEFNDEPLDGYTKFQYEFDDGNMAFEGWNFPDNENDPEEDHIFTNKDPFHKKVKFDYSGHTLYSAK